MKKVLGCRNASRYSRTQLLKGVCSLLLVALLGAGLSLSTALYAQEPPTDKLSADELAASARTLKEKPARGAHLLVGSENRKNANGDRSITVQEKANRLLLPNGKVFHRTDNPVSKLRTVSVPGSSLQIYLWDEDQPSDEKQSFYAISQNGSRMRGRVRATTYKVRLHGRSFDPLVSVPSVSNRLSARAENNLHLVQFVAAPLPEFRGAIKTMGGKVHRFLTDHTFLVEMNTGIRARVAALPYVRWVGPYHPEYRVEAHLRKAIRGEAASLAKQRYSIMLTERGQKKQRAVSAMITRIGGTVELTIPEGYRVEATLTQDQLATIAQANEVQFIDRWGGPGETDMDIVRAVGGADYLEGLEGWTGAGVRGEIFDTELRTTHQEWPTAPIIHSVGTTSASLHGTSCYSINFAQGVGAAARGMVPNGQGIFFRYNESSQFGGAISRYTINSELIDPLGPYRAVFQTSSVGSSRTTLYTTISADVDDYLFKHPILSTQSQSNAGNQNSRPQAWAKNIVAVGGVYHRGTATRTDDSWSGGASIGPAADGRIKPDLAYFYDGIYAARGSGDASYTQFGGTSAATPETAGHFGILFQMWHEQVWKGHGGGATVFDSRPEMATAKALMINHAYRYDWNSGGANADIDRYKQGWGTADIQKMYDRAAVTSVINETDVIAPLETKTYTVHVALGETELNVTMAYTDPMGTVGATHTRINDLSLRVTSPRGLVYWGNNGLTSDNVSTPGGTSNTVDTVENVF
ncbi:MAG TPA: peptidase S8, partial [Nitrospiraceae bacterium]|nr:peptidase S8 [Nitrospiraceae bacterium]